MTSCGCEDSDYCNNNKNTSKKPTTKNPKPEWHESRLALIQTAIDTFLFINSIWHSAFHPILSKIHLLDKINYSSWHSSCFLLLGTLTRIHICTVNLLNESCSEIPFISHLPTLIRHVGNCLPAKTRNCFDKSFIK